MITRYLSTLLLATLLLCGSITPAPAAVLVQSASGTYAVKTTLAAAAIAPDAAGKTVVVTTALSAVQSNISSATLHAWPADRTLRIDRGGSIGNTTTFRVDGPFEAGRNRVFTGTGRVLLSSGKAHPEWWTTNSVPGTTDMSSAIQKAIDSFPADINFATKAIGGTVSYDLGRYRVNTRINNKRGITHEGQGPESTQIILYTTDGGFTYTDIGNNRQDKIVFRNIGIIQDTGTVPTSGAGIEVLEGTQQSQTLITENVYINGTYDGIHGQALVASKLGARISQCVRNGVRLDGTVANTSVNLSALYVDISGDVGVYVDRGTYITLNSTASDSNTGGGYYFYRSYGITMNSAGAEGNNVTGGNFYFELSSGIVLNGVVGVAQAATAADNITFKSCGVVAINGGRLSAGAIEGVWNTGYAIRFISQTSPVTVTGMNFELPYTEDTITDSITNRVEFKNCGFVAPAHIKQLHHQMYGVAITAEGNVYGAPGSVLTVPNNAFRSTSYLKEYGNTATGWKQQRGWAFASSIPTTGTWALGDIAWHTVPATAQPIGWVATTAGTFGTLNGGATTGGITTGTAALTVSSTTGLAVGNFITIAGVTGVKRITDITELVVTLDSNADATVAAAAVAYQAPTLKGFGVIL
jgi:hypothetical protein